MSTDPAPITVPQHVLDYLGEHRKLTLATASPTGVPHAATLLFVNSGPQLYFWTRPETTTAKQVAQNPVVSFTVDDYAETTLWMYWGSFHRRRMVNGYSGFFPPPYMNLKPKMDYFPDPASLDEPPDFSRQHLRRITIVPFLVGQSGVGHTSDGKTRQAR